MELTQRTYTSTFSKSFTKRVLKSGPKHLPKALPRLPKITQRPLWELPRPLQNPPRADFGVSGSRFWTSRGRFWSSQGWFWSSQDWFRSFQGIKLWTDRNLMKFYPIGTIFGRNSSQWWDLSFEIMMICNLSKWCPFETKIGPSWSIHRMGSFGTMSTFSPNAIFHLFFLLYLHWNYTNF